MYEMCVFACIFVTVRSEWMYESLCCYLFVIVYVSGRVYVYLYMLLCVYLRIFVFVWVFVVMRVYVRSWLYNVLAHDKAETDRDQEGVSGAIFYVPTTDVLLLIHTHSIYTICAEVAN